MLNRYFALALSCCATITTADTSLILTGNPLSPSVLNTNSYSFMPEAEGISRFRMELPYIYAENQHYSADTNELFYLSDIYDEGLTLASGRNHFTFARIGKTNSILYTSEFNESFGYQAGLSTTGSVFEPIIAGVSRHTKGRRTLQTYEAGLGSTGDLFGTASTVSLSANEEHETYASLSSHGFNGSTTLSVGRRWFSQIFPLDITAGLEISEGSSNTILVGEHHRYGVHSKIGLIADLENGAADLLVGIEVEKFERLGLQFRGLSQKILGLTVPSLRSIRRQHLHVHWRSLLD